MPPTFLTTEQLSERWGMPLQTLSHWRCEGKGPRFFKPSRNIVRYSMAAILAFEASATIVPLTEHEACAIR